MSRPVIRYHPAVPDDIIEISEYLDTQSQVIADRFRRAVHVTIRQMSRRPMSGSKLEIEGIADGCRKTSVMTFPNHLLIYRPVPNGLRVIAVVHGSRDMRRFLRKRQ